MSARLFLLLFVLPLAAAAQAPEQRLARDIYKELVEINTVTATGDTAAAAEAMAARLRSAGFGADDVRVFTPAPRKGNVVGGCAAPAPSGRSCWSRTSTSSKRAARTG